VDTFSFQAREVSLVPLLPPPFSKASWRADREVLRQFYEREGFEVLYEIDSTLGEGTKKVFLGRKLQPLEAR
jgi:hypothetical protein